MTKKMNSPDDLENIKDGELFEWDGNYVDQTGLPVNFIEQQNQADKEIEILKSSKDRVNFRWNESEIERCKRIAAKRGLKYQTYIKMVLKQAMDNDEKVS